MNESSDLRPDERNFTRRRWAAAVVVVVATLAALTLPASGWIRARSNINVDAEAVAICSSTVTLSSELRHEGTSFDFIYPDFVGVPGVTPYPGLAQDSIPLYGTQLDALANTNAIATVVVPRIFRSFEGTSYFFSGEGEIPTPAGFDNGDFLYASAFDSTLSPIAVPLKIGDPVYDCAPDYLNWAVLSRDNAVQVSAYLPHTIVFDATTVDPKTLTVSLSTGGPAVPVDYLGRIDWLGVARVNLNTVGITCDTTTLVLAGVEAGGYQHVGEIKVFPQGRTCN